DPDSVAADAAITMGKLRRNIQLSKNGSQSKDRFFTGLMNAEDPGYDMGRSVVAVARAAELGDYFEDAIEHPVSLARRKSAMLPIVSKSVEGARVSLYNESTHAKFPLLALKVKNTSGLHLMQGPVTVFEGKGYAGDAHLLDLRAGEERLISYAIDLGT